VREEQTHLLLTDRSGSWPHQLTSDPGDDSDARPAPDGSRIVYVHRPFADLHSLEIRLLTISSGESCLLFGEPGQKAWQPRWSRDGRQIAFLSQKSGFNEIWLVNPDGSGLRQLTAAGLDFNYLNWSPGGNWLAASANRQGAFDLVLVSTRDGSLLNLRGGPGSHLHPRWSPDGTFLTFEYTDPCLPPDIYRLELALDGMGRLGPPAGLTQLTFSNLPALACLNLVIPQPIHYPSYDGLEIHGLIYSPPRPNGAAIVHPHGGPRDQYGYEWDLYVQYLVAKGYTYLAINYRGSTGYGTGFEHANELSWGIGDTQDCLYGARFLAAQVQIDPARIAIMGSSYGGYLTACCLSRDPEHLFACGISLYGDVDLFSSWAQCELTTRLYTEMQIGHPAKNRQVYLAGSPILDVANVQKPVLILHGLEDDVVPPQAAEEWVEALRRAGKTFEYKTYADESHGLLSHANLQDQYQRIERFLDWCLLPIQ
jgi:dipeptidyl aminopeptidase/acylaminoacyl peptidase